jgi:glycosyltransferase involved in cell wall biosynthesis
MKRIVIITPHLSTGGLPQYLLWQVQELQKSFEVYLVEYSFLSGDYVVQRNKILQTLEPNHFLSLGDDKSGLLTLLQAVKPDVVYFQEIPELFCHDSIAKEVYESLNYTVWETTHTSTFEVSSKRFRPDQFIFVSRFNCDQYKEYGVPIEYKPYPILKHERPLRDEALKELGLDPNKKHILNVGLFTPGKNQGEILEYARQLPDFEFHFVGNQAGNFQNYWGPLMQGKPSNCHIWGERNDVERFYSSMDLFLFTSKLELNPLVIKEALSWQMPICMYDLPAYCGEYKAGDQITFLGAFEKNVEAIRNLLENRPLSINPKFHFVGEPYLEIGGVDDGRQYQVQFLDGENIIHQAILGGNAWTRCFRRYFTPWRLLVTCNGQTVLDYQLNLQGQRVYIAFDSNSLGDTIAWIPYCLEFQKKHQCNVIVSTFFNDLFQAVYPELEFVKPGEVVNNIMAQYAIGCFDFDNRAYSTAPWNQLSLQGIASSILGLQHKEIRPRIHVPDDPRPIEGKYICIAIESTAQCKYWNNETGWQEVTKYLRDRGYGVVNLSPLKDFNLILNHLKHCEFFIGLPSGLSWLAWAVQKKVVMISGFSNPAFEFSDKIHVGPPQGTCSGCFNWKDQKFDRGDWNYCPAKKDFECTKTISFQQVIAKLPL